MCTFISRKSKGCTKGQCTKYKGPGKALKQREPRRGAALRLVLLRNVYLHAVGIKRALAQYTATGNKRRQAIHAL